MNELNKDPKKNRKRLLNLIMILAGLILAGTLVEGYSRRETRLAYAGLSRLRESGKLSPYSEGSPGDPAPSDAPASPTGAPQGSRPTLTLPEPSSLPDPKVQFLDVNPDYAGWIRVPGTRIDYPFVRGRDNTEYLRRDFYGRPAKAGTIFMDYRNLGGPSERHLMLYGHNMKDGSMFHDLVNFQDEEFFAAHPTLVLSDLYETRTYRILSVYEISADDFSLPVQFSGSGSYTDFLESLTRRSLHPVPASLPRAGQLLTLITCSYGVGNGRTIVHAVSVSP